MQQTIKSASKLRIVLAWLFVVGNIVFWFAFWVWWSRGRTHTPESSPDLGRSLFLLALGGLFFLAGVVGYSIVLASDCFTYNFQRPVWNRLKAKIYLANIVVPLLGFLGIGLIVAAIVSPGLAAIGISGLMATFVPVLGVIVFLQIVQVWVLIWAPLEQRVIRKRLLAQGVPAAQLQNAVLVGISDPTRSSLKKFAAVEDDIGALWLESGALKYQGDRDQFSITREQLMEIERRADTGSATLLSGVTHIILHARQPDGTPRQIRLHTEGVWTMGLKRKTMDDLAQGIVGWHASVAAAPPPITAS